MMIIVDTSVWSLALRRAKQVDDPARTELGELIKDGRAALIGPIRQEILSGIKDKKQFDLVRANLRAFPDIELASEDYEEAARLFNICRAAGVQGSNTEFDLRGCRSPRNGNSNHRSRFRRVRQEASYNFTQFLKREFSPQKCQLNDQMGKTVLARSKEASNLRLGAIIAVGILLVFALWFCFWAWRIGDLFGLFLYLGGATILVLLLVQIVNKMFRRVVLLEDHFAVVGLFGVPRVYSYDQITNLETIETDWEKWTLDFEPFVRITFADGSTVRIHHGLMNSREFRRLLRKKTGKIFRKPKRKDSWLKKKFS